MNTVDPKYALFSIANEKGPIVDIMPNADVIIHQKGSLPEAAYIFYSELAGFVPKPKLTNERIQAIAAKAAASAAKNAGVAPQLLFADIYFTLQEEFKAECIVSAEDTRQMFFEEFVGETHG